ncbi:alkaline phosphatase family protein [Rothia sp. P6271]|uniref:alkaline phosphatase family protein n=1 Tax=Rothia sp. P6271 TaxID=3402659 RepID=UPI003AC2F201
MFTDYCGVPLPASAPYGSATIADLFESAGTLVKQRTITPDPHPVWGEGAHDAIGLAQRLEQAGIDSHKFRSICVVMVDGLGEDLLQKYSSYAPYLKKSISLGTLHSAIPSTTAASLTSFGTALPPGIHGVAGYEVRNPENDTVVNHLSGWDTSIDPYQWQPYPTVFERYEKHCNVATVSLSRYQKSGLSQFGLRGGEFFHAQAPTGRITLGTSLLSSRKPSLVYMYWGEIDQAGHRFGTGSTQWLYQLEELNLSLRKLAERVPAQTLLLLSADHGMLDIEREHRYDYSADQHLIDNVRLTAGEPRMVQLYLKDNSKTAKEKTLNDWAERWGEKAWIIDTEQACAQGLFGSEVRDHARARIGDILIACREPIALYDKRRAKPHAFEMVGQHGSLTETETTVPLRVLPTQ